MILKAVETGDVAASTRNLLFLLKAGFIGDPQGTIAALANDPEAVPVLPPRAYTSGVFEGATPEGSGGDPEINVLKNRDMPPKQYTHMTLEQIASMPMLNVPNLGSRSSWPADVLKEINDIESRGVTAEGYLMRVRVAGPTAANAKRQDIQGRDWTVSLSSNPNDEISKSVAAVITPRVRSAHPKWTLAKLNELSQVRQRVRVSGWLLFGPRHWMNLERGATRWRIHPVLNIEFQKAQDWISLSDAA